MASGTIGDYHGTSKAARVAIGLFRQALGGVEYIVQHGGGPRCRVADYRTVSIETGLVLDLLDIEQNGDTRTIAIELTASRRLWGRKLPRLEQLLGPERAAGIESHARLLHDVMILQAAPEIVLTMDEEMLRRQVQEGFERFSFPRIQPRTEVTPFLTALADPDDDPTIVHVATPAAATARISNWHRNPHTVVPAWMAGYDPEPPPERWDIMMHPDKRRRHLTWFAFQDQPLAERFPDLPVYEGPDKPAGLVSRFSLYLMGREPAGNPMAWHVTARQLVALFGERTTRPFSGAGFGPGR